MANKQLTKRGTFFRSWRKPTAKRPSNGYRRLLYEEKLEEKTLLSADGFSFLNTDFNQDGFTDVQDLELINAWVGPEDGDAMFVEDLDVNEDDRVNRDDVDFLAQYILGTNYGDADLNGVFDSSDIVVVYLHGEYDDGVANNSGWEEGDWNGDRDFDSKDLVFALQHNEYVDDGGYGAGAEAILNEFFFLDTDFNEDGTTDIKDLDVINQWVGPSGREAYYTQDLDLNGDGAVDRDDVTFVAQYILGTNYGDANLDGVFDSTDLVILYLHGEYEDDVPRNSTWESGDWNGDREFDSADLVFALMHNDYVNTGGSGAADELIANEFSFIFSDVNEDGMTDVHDLDLVNQWVGPGKGDAMYIDKMDINQDGRVNRSDVDFLAQYLVGTNYGDADLNGIFNSTDIVIVYLWGHYDDEIIGNSTWETGDWNGDREFDSADLVMALKHNVYEPDPLGVDALMAMLG